MVKKHNDPYVGVGMYASCGVRSIGRTSARNGLLGAGGRVVVVVGVLAALVAVAAVAFAGDDQGERPVAHSEQGEFRSVHAVVFADGTWAAFESAAGLAAYLEEHSGDLVVGGGYWEVDDVGHDRCWLWMVFRHLRPRVDSVVAMGAEG